MLILRPISITIRILAVLLILSGCTPLQNNTGPLPESGFGPGLQRPSPGTIAILFYRQSNYAGGGRIHILKVDDQPVGQITADNYFRIEIWPGEYKFSVYLPSENFFGQTNPEMSFSEQVRFEPADAGETFTYQFTDGMGTRGFEHRRITSPPDIIFKRIMAGDVSARQTAQVSVFLEARYDGPALYKKPHGIGLLTWPDGTVYKGIFEHGIPTNKARFFFNDGIIFMGVFDKGRPKSPGVLMAPDGRILFAGQFINEKPHGVGLREGIEGPEFCSFDHGRDITVSFEKRAQKILDSKDKEKIEAFLHRIEHIGAQIEKARERLEELRAAVDSDTIKEEISHVEENIDDMESRKKNMERTAQTDFAAFINKLHSTRYRRELSKIKELKKEHQTKVEEERIWCEEEFALGRNLCGCAPLSENFVHWQECVAPIGAHHLKQVFYKPSQQ